MDFASDGSAAHYCDLPYRGVGMPEGHRIDVTHRVVMSRAWGVFSTAEFLAHHQAVAVDPDFDPTFAQLVDLRDVTAFDLDSGTIRAAAFASIFQPGVRRAIVAPSDIGFGLSRMFGTYARSASQTVAVFRAIDEAEHWLGLDATATRASSTSLEQSGEQQSTG